MKINMRYFLIVLWLFVTTTVHAQEDWMPDANLRKVLREKLGLPQDTPLVPSHLGDLTTLKVSKSNIANLQGLEHAQNLQTLHLTDGKISDLTPLAGLTQLAELNLAGNEVRDVAPLAQIYLRVLKLSNNQIRDLTSFKRLYYLFALELDNNQITDIGPLTGLDLIGRLHLSENKISDITPLGEMDKLKYVNLSNNRITDVGPLASLHYLEDLELTNNQITDVGPLASRSNLQVLKLANNQIRDITPIGKLENLDVLVLENNQITDVKALREIGALQVLALKNNPILDYKPLVFLTEIEWQKTTSVPKPKLSVRERIASRAFPSVFWAWAETIGTSNLRSNFHNGYPGPVAAYDLYWHRSILGLHWAKTPEGWELSGDVERAQQIRDEQLSQNPSSVLLMPIGYFTERSDAYPLDFRGWMRDAKGNPRVDGGVDLQEFPKDEAVDFLLDFTRPEVQDMVIQKAVAVAESGTYDGIFLDYWHPDPILHPNHTIETEHHARDTLLQRIRAEVADDFLILVNTHGTPIPRWAEYVNGAYIGLGSDTEQHRRIREEGYTREDLLSIENQLKWAEEHFREPRINCLEGWGLTEEPMNSSRNQQWMRLFTTMSLIFSDGYVLYTTADAPDETHFWYHFWSYYFWGSYLGQPVSEKGKLYDENIEGLYIREFPNGWAVYNRSGKTRTIELPEPAWSMHVARMGKKHGISDLNGDIYLK